jgi:hypothetical protein
MDIEQYRKSESIWSKIIIWVCISPLIVFVFFVLFPPIPRSKDKTQFNRCAQTLSGLKVAEEMYHSDNNKYADNESLEKLGLYMIRGCTHENGCGTAVADQIGTAAKPKYCKDYEIKVSANGLDYQITGTAMDRNKCKICVTSKGILPENYSDCSKQMKMKCP